MVFEWFQTAGSVTELDFTNHKMQRQQLLWHWTASKMKAWAETSDSGLKQFHKPYCTTFYLSYFQIKATVLLLFLTNFGYSALLLQHYSIIPIFFPFFFYYYSYYTNLDGDCRIISEKSLAAGALTAVGCPVSENKNQIIICLLYRKTTVIIRKIIILTVLGGQGYL